MAKSGARHLAVDAKPLSLIFALDYRRGSTAWRGCVLAPIRLSTLPTGSSQSLHPPNAVVSTLGREWVQKGEVTDQPGRQGEAAIHCQLPVGQGCVRGPAATLYPWHIRLRRGHCRDRLHYRRRWFDRKWQHRFARSPKRCIESMGRRKSRMARAACWSMADL